MKVTITKFFNQKSDKRVPWCSTDTISKKKQWQQTCDDIYKMLEDPTVNAVQINLVKGVKEVKEEPRDNNDITEKAKRLHNRIVKHIADNPAWEEQDLIKAIEACYVIIKQVLLDKTHSCNSDVLSQITTAYEGLNTDLSAGLCKQSETVKEVK